MNIILTYYSYFRWYTALFSQMRKDKISDITCKVFFFCGPNKQLFNKQPTMVFSWPWLNGGKPALYKIGALPFSLGAFFARVFFRVRDYLELDIMSE